VNNQASNQKFQDPWLAIVVDPVRTIAQGKVQLGAFRTYPDDYKPADAAQDWQSVPLDKVKDFGVYANRYYALEVSYFKSVLDSNLLELLWSKYWVNALSANPLAATRSYMTSSLRDLTVKFDGVESSLAHSGRQAFFSAKKKEDSQLTKITKDSTKMTLEQLQGLMSQVIKDRLFNQISIQDRLP